MKRLSVLDLAPIVEGSDAAAAFRNSLDLARHVERLGFHRFWLAEHHGMPGIASAALLYEVSPLDGGTIAAAAVMLAATAIIASVIPILRARRMSIVTELRSE